MAATVVWRKVVAQDRVKATLSSAFSNGTLGHAYLFCGDVGTGTFQAALELSMALLCSCNDTVPCGQCESCRKVLHYAHPDFHVIMPVCLEKEHRASDDKLNQEGWDYLSSVVQARIADPYRLPRYSKVPSVPVEWVKEVNHAIMRGPVFRGMNAIIIDTVDLLNKESANAMLKTIEDPPADTVIILMTQRPQAVLPTIASRCQLLRFGYLPHESIRNEIIGRFGASIPQTAIDEAVTYSMGSLGQAIHLCENPIGKLIEESQALLAACMAEDWLTIAAHVDALAREGDFEHHEKLLLHFVHLFRNALVRQTPLYRATGSENGPAPDRTPDDLLTIGPEQATRLMKASEDAIYGVRTHGHISIILVNFIMTVMEIIHEQKQQTGGSRL